MIKSGSTSTIVNLDTLWEALRCCQGKSHRLNREGKGTFIKGMREGTSVQMESALHAPWAKFPG